MRSIKTLLIFILLSFENMSLSAYGQMPLVANFNEQKKIALEKLSTRKSQDTARINALVEVFRIAPFVKQQLEVITYAEEALGLSRKLDYKFGLAAAYNFFAHYNKSSLQKNKALVYFDSVLLVAGDSKEQNLCELRTHANEWKGMVYHEQENYYPALNFYLESLKEPNCNSTRAILAQYSKITNIYLTLKNFDKSHEFALKIVDLIADDSIRSNEPEYYFPIIDVSFAKNDLAIASNYLDKISAFIPVADEFMVNFGYYRRRGYLYEMKGEFRKAFIFYQQAYKYALFGKHKANISVALGLLSGSALKMGNLRAAREYAMMNLGVAEETNAKLDRIDALNRLANYYQVIGNGDTAFRLLQMAMTIKDSVLAESNVKQVNVLAAIYEADKNQQEISKLQTEKILQNEKSTLNSLLNKVFIAIIVVILIMSLLLNRNFRNHRLLAKKEQELQRQRIIELEKDRQLLAVDAMLEGQEEERARIAKDLHDGLGSMMSGTKLALVSVKEALPQDSSFHPQFDHSLKMLDDSIDDLRRIAYNLMPQALARFGLNEALRDFCDGIQSSTGTAVVYQYYGNNRKPGNTADVFIYRIVQELVNNAIKHANAQQVLVQLSVNDSRVGITVEDNGKGFDKSILESSVGAGMQNIKHRVQYLNGTIDLVTTPGNGTSVNIELMA